MIPVHTYAGWNLKQKGGRQLRDVNLHKSRKKIQASSTTSSALIHKIHPPTSGSLYSLPALRRKEFILMSVGENDTC